MRFATERDVDNLIAFLGQADIDGKSIREIYGQFMVVEDENGTITGTIGYEKAGNLGLLRSLVLKSGVDQAQLLYLMQSFFFYLEKQAVEKLYLVTDKKQSVPLFHAFGFEAVEKSDVPHAVSELQHFKRSIERPGSFILCGKTRL
ncbi:mechanosensitive ion channel protein [Ectobacillus antri]|jgi:N-acetylglutamate synthase-like GNAT family acetyltransferase|uniref:mechanosensitive ion channel protein n=1 Tax=Ectobacillus antri TaxID=2486280 RepID=UPI000F5A1F15|nr:mechanosensitive ion channel protein [Ectobacillus antri]